jgi:hypothetical protein
MAVDLSGGVEVGALCHPVLHTGDDGWVGFVEDAWFIWRGLLLILAGVDDGAELAMLHDHELVHAVAGDLEIVGAELPVSVILDADGLRGALRDELVHLDL